MVLKICCIPFCGSKKNDGIPIFEFPSDLGLRQLWLNSILEGMALDHFEIGVNSGVCANHFEKHCLTSSRDGRTYIKKKSVPTIFEQPAGAWMMPTTSKQKKFKTTDWIFANTQVNESCGMEMKVEDSASCPQVIPMSSEVETPESFSEPQKEPTPNEPSSAPECIDSHVDMEIIELRRSLKKVMASEKYLKQMLANKNETLKNLQSKNDQLMKENRKLMKLKKVEEECMNNNATAIFLMDQLNNFGKQRPAWSEMTIRNCMLWKAKSPKGYYFAKDFLKLPSRTTLERYIGSSNEEIGLTDLIRTRLITEAEQLTDIEKVCSLIIDDMKIREKLTYAKKEDRFFGLDTTTDNPIGNRPILANQLMCFVLHGLSTKITIPAGYFFHKQLSTEKFYELTIKIIQQIHDCGFRVIRIVTDNHKSNVALFKKFGNGSVMSEVEHPIIPHSPLFLSFDYCHIIKNARNLFLNNDMASETGIITSDFVKGLYNLQKNLYIKPVPFLTRKHVMPTNIEKMNVKRAVQLFSPKVTASIEYLGKYKHSNFLEYDATIEYMQNMYTFFKLHDVNESTQHIRQNDPLSAPYMNLDDSRLEWLSKDFPDYIKSIQNYSENVGVKGLSKETAEAMILTAESTVKTVNYLLNSGFYYVLTRRLSSDAVEGLFSQLRLGGGFQDATDARAAHYALRRIIRSGIIKSEDGANIASRVSSVGPSISSQQKEFSDYSNIILSEEILLYLDELKINLSDIKMYGISSASVAMMSGYILRTIEERISCQFCLTQISSTKSDNLLFGLIYLQDRGGLKYPSREFVYIINILSKVLIEVFKIIPRNENPKKVLLHVVFPHLLECKIGFCMTHKEPIYNLILEKLSNPLLESIGNTRTDNAFNPFPIETKPLSKKINKMT